jgi:hypothetical protein
VDDPSPSPTGTPGDHPLSALCAFVTTSRTAVGNYSPNTGRFRRSKHPAYRRAPSRQLLVPEPFRRFRRRHAPRESALVELLACRSLCFRQVEPEPAGQLPPLRVGGIPPTHPARRPPHATLEYVLGPVPRRRGADFRARCRWVVTAAGVRLQRHHLDSQDPSDEEQMTVGWRGGDESPERSERLRPCRPVPPLVRILGSGSQASP